MYTIFGRQASPGLFKMPYKAISSVWTPTMAADIGGADPYSANVRLQLRLHRAYFLLTFVEQALDNPFADFVSPEVKVSWERLEIGVSKTKLQRIMRMSGGWSSHITGHSNGDTSLFECPNDFVSISSALDGVGSRRILPLLWQKGARH